MDFANHMTGIDPYNTYGLPKDQKFKPYETGRDLPRVSGKGSESTGHSIDNFKTSFEYIPVKKIDIKPVFN